MIIITATITTIRPIPGKAYISSIKEMSTPYFKSLRLNYTNTPVGKDRSLVGTIKNIGPVDVQNVSVFASAHDNKTRQIDSVKSRRNTCHKAW